MLEAIFTEFGKTVLLIISIFGVAPWIAICFGIQRKIFGDRPEKMAGLIPLLNIGVYGLLYFWFMMWFLVDVTGMYP